MVTGFPLSQRLHNREFEDFMRPGIDWITPAEYAAAFDGLVAEDELEQTAFERACARELRGEVDE